jgi:predicted membrane GTPase involved in stress response
VYFLGIERVNIKEVETGIYTTINPIDKIDIDANFDFPDELLETLKTRVINMARMDYFFPVNNGANTGDDNTMQKPTVTPKVMSVNEQPQQEQ